MAEPNYYQNKQRLNDYYTQPNKPHENDYYTNQNHKNNGVWNDSYSMTTHDSSSEDRYGLTNGYPKMPRSASKGDLPRSASKGNLPRSVRILRSFYHWISGPLQVKV